VASFSTLDAAANAAAVAAGLNASACELLERTFLDIARRGDSYDVPAGADAVLLVEIEEASHADAARKTAAVMESFERAGALKVDAAADHSRSDALWALRHAASPILASLAPATISMQVIEDGAVPPDRLPEYVRGLRSLLARAGFGGVIFGHAGDGHVHANVLVDQTVAGWQARLETVFEEGTALITSLGGTPSGEHGDGRLRAGILPAIWPAEAIERFRKVKDAFDPDGLLNPGVKFAVAGAPLLGGMIKYDETADFPAEARRALDRVQRDRVWNASRLELLQKE
jgi:FAD/FMN-containing dehydrogenase